MSLRTIVEKIIASCAFFCLFCLYITAPLETIEQLRPESRTFDRLTCQNGS